MCGLDRHAAASAARILSELRRPTLVEVANAAGVSLKTASRVMNAELNVSATTRERVLEAAGALGFRRNAAAADLARSGASRLVGFITGDIANPFYSGLASGLERGLRASGMQLMTASSEESAAREQMLATELIERRVAALVIVPTNQDQAHLASEVANGLPLVVVDRPAEGVDADTVVIDNRGGIRRAVEHLVKSGHRRIALIGDLPRLWTF